MPRNAHPSNTSSAAHSRGLAHPRYIEELYELARDTSPRTVFLEDIDLTGQARQESCYSRGEALAQFLFELDGLEECRSVVTIATTNWLDILDAALKDRPYRFDRVVAFEPPGYEERLAYIDYLAQRILVPAQMRERLAKQSEGLTPAQIQEAVHGVVIEAGIGKNESPDWEAIFSPDSVDVAVVKVRRRTGRIGFNTRADTKEAGTERCPECRR
jgi:AAA+ superfamily predicted ATPase